MSLQFLPVSNRTYSVLFAPGVAGTVWETMLDVGTQLSTGGIVTDPRAPTLFTPILDDVIARMTRRMWCKASSPNWIDW